MKRLSGNNRKSGSDAIVRPVSEKLTWTGITKTHLGHIATGLAFAYAAVLWISHGNPIAFGLLPFVLLIRVAIEFIGKNPAAAPSNAPRPVITADRLQSLIGDTMLILPFMTVEPFSAPWILAIVLLVWLVEFSAGLQASDRRATPGGPMNKSGCAIVFALLGVLVWTCKSLSPVFYWFQPIMCFSVIVTLLRCGQSGAAQSIAPTIPAATGPERIRH